MTPQQAFAEQTDRALAALSTRSAAADEAVHTARKAVRKARAYLRLFRDGLGERRFRREDTLLRDIARPLSAVRDAEASLETLDDLLTGSGGTVQPPAAAILRRALARELRLRRALLRQATLLKPMRDSLRRLQGRAARWRLGPEDRSEPGAQVRPVYRNGRRAFAKARRNPSVQALHEWRKQAKYLWHQLQFLEPLVPANVRRLSALARKLADCLGEDHDLAVLFEVVLRRSAVDHRDAVTMPLIMLIDERRAALQKKALRIGRKLYCDRPKRFMVRLRRQAASSS